MSLDLSQCEVGSRIWFDDQKKPFRVRARSKRFLVCTKPFNPRRTVLYTIVDLEQEIRGTENLIFGLGAETDTECWQMLCRLEGVGHTIDFKTEVSYRNNVPLNPVRIEAAHGAD